MRGFRGHATPEKRFGFQSFKYHPLGFRVFRRGNWPDFKIKAWKFNFKTLSIFKNLTFLRKTVETGLNPGLGMKLAKAFHRQSDTHAQAIQTCGPPNPLNAVLEGILVLHT